MTNHPKTSQLVSSQVPGFVRADHPLFVSFLEAYYEWLESTGDVGQFQGGLDLLSQRDIDSTFDSFVQYFKKEYLLNFPEKLAVDNDGIPVNERNLVKNIRQFFRAKGSEKSYEFLFRILYNSAVEFYYPKEDVLRLSDGKWVERVSIKTTANNGTNLYNLLQREIKQRNNAGVVTAYARVSDLQLYAVDGVEIAELFLAGVFGTFEHTRNIEGVDDDGNLLTEQVYPVISSIEISDFGQDYQPGETLYLKRKDPTQDPTGVGFLARIDEVDTQNSLYKSDESIQLGSIKKLRIVDFGVNYVDTSDWKLIVDSPFGSGAEFDITIGGMSKYPGYYDGTDGQLSSQKKIQDSHYYQQFSYVLKVESSFDNWIDAIKKIIHPAGMEVFGEVLLYRRRIDTVDASHNELRVYENPLIGHYTPYRFQTYENLRKNSAGVDLYPQGYNPYVCSVSGGDGRGTVPEGGTIVHNPYSVPSGWDGLSGPLSANIDDIFGHNAHCPDYDPNNAEFGSDACVTGWAPCDATPFAIANGATNADGLTGGYGCCTNTSYWIIYPHPNSRGIDLIPPTVNVRRLWFYDTNIDSGHRDGLHYKFDVHEKIHQVLKKTDLDNTQITGSDIRPFIDTQAEAEVGIIYDIEWFEYGTTQRLTGPDGNPFNYPVAFRLDVFSENDTFLGSDYEGVTGYYLETQYSGINIQLGEISDIMEGIDASVSSIDGDWIRANVVVENTTIPNPFIHIIINDFLHMPIDSGTTGNAYQFRSTTKEDLSYNQVR